MDSRCLTVKIRDILNQVLVSLVSHHKDIHSQVSHNQVSLHKDINNQVSHSQVSHSQVSRLKVLSTTKVTIGAATT